jgi:hypothetical protein
MKTGQVVQRGFFRDGNALNKTYIDQILGTKFEVPKSEFEREQFLNELVPRDHVWNRKMRDFVKEKIRDSSEIPGEILKDPKHKGTVYEHVARNIAWQFWLSKLEMEEEGGKIKAEFNRNFHRWLMGVGTKEDIQKTPWGKQAVKDKEVLAYLGNFVDAKYDFLHAMQKLTARAMMGNLEGIHQHYLFYKYIVAGEWTNKDAGFLSDWHILLEASNRVPLYGDIDEARSQFITSDKESGIGLYSDDQSLDPEKRMENRRNIEALDTHEEMNKKHKEEEKENDPLKADHTELDHKVGKVESSSSSSSSEELDVDEQERKFYERVYAKNVRRLEKGKPPITEEQADNDWKLMKKELEEISNNKKINNKKKNIPSSDVIDTIISINGTTLLDLNEHRESEGLSPITEEEYKNYKPMIESNPKVTKVLANEIVKMQEKKDDLSHFKYHLNTTIKGKEEDNNTIINENSEQPQTNPIIPQTTTINTNIEYKQPESIYPEKLSHSLSTYNNLPENEKPKVFKELVDMGSRLNGKDTNLPIIIGDISSKIGDEKSRNDLNNIITEKLFTDIKVDDLNKSFDQISKSIEHLVHSSYEYREPPFNVIDVLKEYKGDNLQKKLEEFVISNGELNEVALNSNKNIVDGLKSIMSGTVEGFKSFLDEEKVKTDLLNKDKPEEIIEEPDPFMEKYGGDNKVQFKEKVDKLNNSKKELTNFISSLGNIDPKDYNTKQKSEFEKYKISNIVQEMNLVHTYQSNIDQRLANSNESERNILNEDRKILRTKETYLLNKMNREIEEQVYAHIGYLQGIEHMTPADKKDNIVMETKRLMDEQKESSEDTMEKMREFRTLLEHWTESPEFPVKMLSVNSLVQPFMDKKFKEYLNNSTKQLGASINLGKIYPKISEYKSLSDDIISKNITKMENEWNSYQPKDYDTNNENIPFSDFVKVAEISRKDMEIISRSLRSKVVNFQEGFISNIEKEIDNKDIDDNRKKILKDIQNFFFKLVNQSWNSWIVHHKKDKKEDLLSVIENSFIDSVLMEDKSLKEFVSYGT